MNICSKITRLAAIAFGSTMLMAGFPQIAQAYTCSTALVLANDGCAQGNFAYDTPANIATDAPFGIADWTVLDTSNDGTDDGAQGIVLLTVDIQRPNLGIWAIVSLGQSPWNLYDNLMITLQSTPGDYVAYSLKQDAKGGLYFIAANEPALIHARLWGTVTAVPLPMSAWLFGSGLSALVMATRRRNAA